MAYTDNNFIVDFEKKNKIEISGIYTDKIYYPKFSWGFQHYIHQSTDKMRDIVEKYENKNKVYTIVYPFFKNIDDYQNDIENSSIHYFGLEKNSPRIESDTFYEFWEILKKYNIIPKNMIVTCMSEDPQPFIHSLILQNEKNKIKNNNKMFQIQNIPKNKNKFFDYYSKYINITSKYTPSDLIIIDNYYDWKDAKIQEQLITRKLMKNIVSALKSLKNGGNLICKIFESFTNSTVQIIGLFCNAFEKVSIYKPYISPKITPEKYLICEKFNTKGKEIIIKKLENILTDGKHKYIMDIMGGNNFGNNYQKQIVDINTKLSNEQYMAINNIVIFLEKQNFRGDDYNNYRQMQIESTEFWKEMFLT